MLELDLLFCASILATSHKVIARMVPPTFSPQRTLIKPKCCKVKTPVLVCEAFKLVVQTKCYQPISLVPSAFLIQKTGHNRFGSWLAGGGVGVSIREENHLNNSKLHSLSARRYSPFLCLCCILCFPPSLHTSKISKYLFFIFLFFCKSWSVALEKKKNCLEGGEK